MGFVIRRTLCDDLEDREERDPDRLACVVGKETQQEWRRGNLAEYTVP